jgi:hypothetical protein
MGGPAQVQGMWPQSDGAGNLPFDKKTGLWQLFPIASNQVQKVASP